MDSCLDFEQEVTLLQSMGCSMGALVDRTPKCHCEQERASNTLGDAAKICINELL